MNFTFNTYYTDSDGVEHDIKVSYDYSPGEYNFPEQIEVCEAINSSGSCVLDSLTMAQLVDLDEYCWEDYSKNGEREQAMREDAADAPMQ